MSKRLTKPELSAAIAAIMQLNKEEKEGLEKATLKALLAMWNWIRLNSGKVGEI